VPELEKDSVCREIRRQLLEQVELCRTEMNRAQESANAEEKSSAGDKYETGRAMSQQQRDFFARQLENALAELQFFDIISSQSASGIVKPGSLISTNNLLIFIGKGFGMRSISNGKNLVGVSSESPLGKSLLGKKKGDEFSLAGKMNLIDLVL
jgi:transcription elongation GreA/GreB family factor